jgi:hypothetical protein
MHGGNASIASVDETGLSRSAPASWLRRTLACVSIQRFCKFVGPALIVQAQVQVQLLQWLGNSHPSFLTSSTMVMGLPHVAVCTKCGKFNYNAVELYAPCNEQRDGLRCDGFYRSAIKPGDWVKCIACGGTAPDCALCQGTGWNCARPRS